MKYQTLAGLALVALSASCLRAEPTRKMPSEFAKTTASSSESNEQASEPLVQLALLLDTSGSMEGLVDQARYQLWNVVQDLATANLEDQRIRLEIGVYQYGTDQVSKKNNCLRQIIPFTENLDDVSRGLFSLHVSGGDEYCGAAVKSALENLSWSEQPGVYRAIFLAGNEYFDQGSITFGESLPMLKNRRIFVNTIYCGTKYEGRDQWEKAASIAGGQASFIDHNHHLPKVATPYDGKMRELNREMNETFVWFGNGADKAATNQSRQDRNADKMSDNAFAARMSAKIGHLYHHVDHDLVDAMQRGKAKLGTMPEAKMPTVLQDLSPSDREDYMETMIAKRESVRRRMADTLSLRHQFLERELQKQGTGKVVWGEALRKSIREQASSLGYRFSESKELAQTP